MAGWMGARQHGHSVLLCCPWFACPVDDAGGGEEEQKENERHKNYSKNTIAHSADLFIWTVYLYG